MVSVLPSHSMIASISDSLLTLEHPKGKLNTPSGSSETSPSKLSMENFILSGTAHCLYI